MPATPRRPLLPPTARPGLIEWITGCAWSVPAAGVGRAYVRDLHDRFVAVGSVAVGWAAVGGGSGGMGRLVARTVELRSSSGHDLLPEGRRRPGALIAPARRYDAAADPVADARSKSVYGRWQEAIKIRQEWLDHGLSTHPADRPTAEHSLTAIYARMSRPRPRFEWVQSPHQAIPLVSGLPTLDQLYEWIRDPRPRGVPPLASDLAMVAAQLRGALSAGLSHLDPELSAARKGKHNQPWPQLPPLQALEVGVPLSVVLHQGIRAALHRSLAHRFRNPVRSALAGPVPVCWYGQQDAAWVAYYDALHRLGSASYGPDALDHLGHWAALARSCGWWWPGEDVCVVVDRPDLVRTEPVPGTWHEEVRLQRDGVRYRDGWQPHLA